MYAVVKVIIIQRFLNIKSQYSSVLLAHKDTNRTQDTTFKLYKIIQP